jgi:type IV pilus assembly protein PilO
MASAKPSLGALNLSGRIAVGVVLMVLPLVVYFVVFHGDIQTEIDSARNQNQQLGTDLTDAQVAERAYQKDLEELREREQTRREMMKILPETTEYPAFLSSIQNIANLVGVQLRGWTPQEEVPEEFYARVPMKLELGGRFHQLAKFFYYVGRSERIINMENIALTDPKLVDGELRLNATVMASAFHAVLDNGNVDPKKRGAK